METEPQKEPFSYLTADEWGLLMRFLVLVRDNYRKADKATFFLERRAGVTSLQAVTNLRDVLSHLATFLGSDTPIQSRPEQLANAEEHLRRAIIEPYELAIGNVTEKFTPLYEKYKARLLPITERHTALTMAPNQVQVEVELGEIRKLVEKGKNAKGNNRWNDEWEEGVQAWRAAYDKFASLLSELEGKWYAFEQIERDFARDADLAKESKRNTLLHVWGIVATVLLGALAIVVSYLLATR